MTTPLDGQTLRKRQEVGNAGVGHTVHDVLPLPSGRDKVTPLQACQVIRDPASRGAHHRDELRNCALPFEQHLEHAEARGVSESSEVPSARGHGRCRRTGIAKVSRGFHALTITGFPVTVKRKTSAEGGLT